MFPRNLQSPVRKRHVLAAGEVLYVLVVLLLIFVLALLVISLVFRINSCKKVCYIISVVSNVD